MVYSIFRPQSTKRAPERDGRQRRWKLIFSFFILIIFRYYMCYKGIWRLREVVSTKMLQNDGKPFLGRSIHNLCCEHISFSVHILPFLINCHSFTWLHLFYFSGNNLLYVCSLVAILNYNKSFWFVFAGFERSEFGKLSSEYLLNLAAMLQNRVKKCSICQRKYDDMFHSVKSGKFG